MHAAAPPQQTKRMRLTRTSYEAAYFEVGTGTPVVFLHGFMGNKTNWLPLVERLQPHACCLSLDLLGFGESSQPPIRYDIAAEVAFVRDWIEVLALERPVLVGHSFGAWVTAAYALQHKVSGCILVAPAGIRDDDFSRRYRHLYPLLWETPLVDWGLTLLSGLSAIGLGKEAIARLRFVRRQLHRQPVAKSFLRDRLRPEAAIDTVETRLPSISVPTLVIAAENDDTIPLWHAQTYARDIPHARLEIIPDAGHNLLRSHPQALFESILPFLASEIPPA